MAIFQVIIQVLIKMVLFILLVLLGVHVLEVVQIHEE